MSHYNRPRDDEDALVRELRDMKRRLADLERRAPVGATGSGSASLGANCPAATPGTPITWVKATLANGTAVYTPAWA